MAGFFRDLEITPNTRVLDVGGTFYNWQFAPHLPRLTLMNISAPEEPLPPGVHWVTGDGCALPFAAGSFDVVFSNSVIEHLGTPERQQRFAREITRVGRRYCVQTPNRRFPVETHLWTPGVHFLPKRWQAPIVRRWTVWAALTGIRGERHRFYIEHYLRDIQLLDARQLQALFPGGRLVKERVCGVTKSLLIYR